MNRDKKKLRQMRMRTEEFIKAQMKAADSADERTAAVEKWLDMLDFNLRRIFSEAMDSFVLEQGHIQAFLVGLARFTNGVISEMEDCGLTFNTCSIWDYYYHVLLPAGHNIEQMLEKPDDIERELVEALSNPSVSISQIIDKFFSHLPEDLKVLCMDNLQAYRDRLLNAARH